MENKEKIKLQWQNNIYEIGIEHPWSDQFQNTEIRAEFATTIDDEPKQISFYLYGSLMEPKTPDLIHPYLEKLFKRKFSVGNIKTDKNQIRYFTIHNSDDYGATVIWINNNEARIQFERSLGVNTQY